MIVISFSFKVIYDIFFKCLKLHFFSSKVIYKFKGQNRILCFLNKDKYNFPESYLLAKMTKYNKIDPDNKNQVN